MIPSIHRVDGLRELRTARLVDAASVHPSPLKAIPSRYSAALSNLLEAFLLHGGAALEILEGYLFLAPGVGEDCVRWDLAPDEFVEL